MRKNGRDLKIEFIDRVMDILKIRRQLIEAQLKKYRTKRAMLIKGN